MSNNIIRLNNNTINQIAAGEVIDKPSGVIRELIENSIDAESKKISITINYDDLTFVIKDDGIGIEKEQILTAFERHTTSKIKNFQDIFNTHTLGFRGEALASIASISQVVIITSANYGGVGSKVVLEGGEKISEETIATRRGTEIKISKLFFNTPVRKKFFNVNNLSLSESIDYSNSPLVIKLSERKSIKEEIINHILAADNIHFNFKTIVNNVEKEEINLANTFKLKDKILHFFETRDRAYPLADTLIAVDEKIDHLNMSGYITNFHCREKRNNKQYLIVKNRMVRDAYFFKAIQSAYLHKIPYGTHPICFLKITAPEKEVDFNIHPRKEQVKFRDPNLFFKVIQMSVKNTLSKHHFSRPIDSRSKSQSQSYSQSSLNDFPLSNKPWSVSDVNNITNLNQPQSALNLSSQNQSVRLNNLSDPTLPSNNELPSQVEQLHQTTQPPESLSRIQPKILGQVAKCYILFSIGEDLFITDQHAAHERINFDLINHKLSQKTSQQILLVPYLVNKSSMEIDRILTQKANLEKFGYTVERFGETTLRIEKIPDYLPEKKIKLVVDDLLELAANQEINQAHDFIGAMTARMACRISVMAGDILNEWEMKELISEIFEKDYIYTCPHGRPFVKKIALNELEHFFDRGRHIR